MRYSLLSQKAISLSCKSNALMDGTVSYTMYAQRMFICIHVFYYPIGTE